jgi:uncharacterized protein YoxC
MDTIPPVFWMIIIAFVTIFFCLILYYIAMLFKETSQTVSEVKKVVRDSRGMIKNIEKIVEETTEIIGAVKRTTLMIENTAGEVKEQIITPIKRVGGILASVAGFLGSFRKK